MALTQAQARADLASLLPGVSTTWTLTRGTPALLSSAAGHTGEVDVGTGQILWVADAAGNRLVVLGRTVIAGTAPSGRSLGTHRVAGADVEVVETSENTCAVRS